MAASHGDPPGLVCGHPIQDDYKPCTGKDPVAFIRTDPEVAAAGSPADGTRTTLDMTESIFQKIEDRLTSEQAFVLSNSDAEQSRPPSPELYMDEGFVFVDEADVVEALSAFIAACIWSNKEARKMEPKQLRSAVGRAFSELRQSRITKAWVWGSAAYRAVALSYSAFTVYENPWLVRAVWTALWASARLMLRMAAA